METSNVVPFVRPSISDGSGGGNWLRNMAHGTRFLARRNSMNDSKLCDFVVASDPRAMPAVFLGEEINSREGGFRFVDPDRFIRDYSFYMTLEILEPPNGNNNQIQPIPVVSNARPKKRTKVHEGEQRIPPGDEPGSV